ncbi:rhomboid family intramembrane serine protease [Pseudothermotoga sp.]|nr:rhomboid family intramembrane serine protease [Pseudothermotoga sp.]MCX7813301.1 rhomboid family intramembrane serine protease [Pseudothermotoga sp.]MDW8140614.1 rhomboid family intramembrane serine protease [Pseudothermotoga sp.]
MIPLYDTIPSRRKPYVVYTLIGLNVSVFIYQLFLSRIELIEFLYNFGLVPARFTSNRWSVIWQVRTGLNLYSNKWSTLLTHMFIHGGWSHLIGNMWFLGLFGDNIEDELGHMRFLIFYLSSGVIASLTHFSLNLSSQVPMVGASGAISAVMGAYFVLFPYSRIVSLVPFYFFMPFLVAIPAFTYLFFWFLFQVLSGLFDSPTGSGVAYWAHIGGFVVGMIYGYIRRKRRYYW